MVVLGFILIVVAVLAGLGVAISSGSSASIEGFGVELETTAAVVYFAGAATAIVLLAGVWLMMKGSARTYRRRQEVRALRRQVGTAPAAPAAGTESAATDEARHAARPDDVPTQEDKPDSAPADDGERPATAR